MIYKTRNEFVCHTAALMKVKERTPDAISGAVELADELEKHGLHCWATEEAPGPLPHNDDPDCTGFAADWCPVHGTCACGPRSSHWPAGSTVNPNCPLHAEGQTP